MIINGKEAADAAKEDIKRKVETYGVKPTIVVYQVGDNVASNAYVKNKIKACEYCGINCIHKHFDNITQEELISNIEADNNDGRITGMIVQLPLPKGFDEYTIINTINPDKDIDGFTNVNLGKLMSNDKTGLYDMVTKRWVSLLNGEISHEVKGGYVLLANGTKKYMFDHLGI